MQNNKNSKNKKKLNKIIPKKINKIIPNKINTNSLSSMSMVGWVWC